jgi:hypothetical protein
MLEVTLSNVGESAERVSMKMTFSSWPLLPIHYRNLAKAIISTWVEEMAGKTLVDSEMSGGEKGSWWCARETPNTAEPSSEWRE